MGITREEKARAVLYALKTIDYPCRRCGLTTTHNFYQAWSGSKERFERYLCECGGGFDLVLGRNRILDL